MKGVRATLISNWNTARTERSYGEERAMMAEEHQVNLIGPWGSPFVKRVELALKRKGIQYEYIEEDLTDKSPLLLEYNPIHNKVPVLLHTGKPIVEPLIILEYIDETWKENPILPEDPYERAKARFWAKFIDEKCLDTIRAACCSDGGEREELVVKAKEKLKILENELNGKKFFGGETIGFVDISASLLAWLMMGLPEVAGFFSFDEDNFPVLHKWTEEFLSLSVVKETLPPRDELLGFFRAHYEALAAPKSRACDRIEELLLFYVLFILVSMFFALNK